MQTPFEVILAQPAIDEIITFRGVERLRRACKQLNTSETLRLAIRRTREQLVTSITRTPSLLSGLKILNPDGDELTLHLIPDIEKYHRVVMNGTTYMMITGVPMSKKNELGRYRQPIRNTTLQEYLYTAHMSKNVNEFKIWFTHELIEKPNLGVAGATCEFFNQLELLIYFQHKSIDVCARTFATQLC